MDGMVLRMVGRGDDGIGEARSRVERKVNEATSGVDPLVPQ